MAFEKGTEVTAFVDGGEWDGRVIRTYIEDGVEFVEIDSGEEPFWTGDYFFDAPVDSVRVIPPAI